jgi:drug/metabolite transporter (DMT)-like permease
MNGWILCAVFAFLITTLAVVFFQQSAFMIGGEKTSILSALEPTTGIIVGAVVFKEHITPLVAIGSILVVGASILIAISDMKKAKEEKSEQDNT